MNGFAQFLEATQFSPVEIARRTDEIHEAVLRNSQAIDASNFKAIDTRDLAFLFDEYDRSFFDARCRSSMGSAPLTFRLSRRMTSAGGMTTRVTSRKGESRYEIAVSTTLLFQTFHDLERQIVVTGLVCHDRLQALQRIFEHELIHLLEMLVYSKSSCKADRFQTLARNFFGHTDHRHQLITPKERAVAKYGLRPGSRVKFRFDGREYHGMLNRVTRRATVLVEDAKGRPFSDGKRYATFYVPLELLEATG